MVHDAQTARRPVTIVGVGGTIAMVGAQATPALDAQALADAVPELRDASDLKALTVRHLPGASLSLDDALAAARAACDEAEAGRGVVVTSGTDTIEELAVLCDLMHGGEAPIVVTGAIRPASATGADGPANLRDAATVAASHVGADLGAVVVFGGQIHAARFVRKADSTGPTAFASAQVGPLGYVEEDRVAVLVRPPRTTPLDVQRLNARVPIVTAALGDDGRLIRLARADGIDGLVMVAFGAGHLSPAALDEVERTAREVPVVAVCRPERGALLRSTYGFRGSEGDLRGTGAIPAGRLSPQAARITLIAAIGANLTAEGLVQAFAGADP